MKKRALIFTSLSIVTLLAFVFTTKSYATALYSEDFGGSSQHLESHNSDWTNLSSYYITDSGNVGTNSDQTGGHEAVYYGPTIASADVKYEISYKVDTSGNNIIYIIDKSNTSLNTGYAVRFSYDNGQDHMWIQDRAGGFLEQYDHTVSRSNGDWVDLEMDYNGGSFTLKINGSTVDTYSDSTYLATTGRIGLICLGCSVKDLSIEDYTTPTATPTPDPVAAGWTSAGGSWTYLSSTTITVPSGATDKYAAGDKIRLKQGGGYKYFYVTGVTSTVLTVTGGSDYSVANSAITDNDFSKVVSPVGFPQWFNFPASFSGGGSMTVSNIQNVIGKFAINGRDVHVLVSASVDTSGTASTTINVGSLPVGPNTGSSSLIGAALIDDGSGGSLEQVFADTNTLKLVNDSNISLTSGVHVGTNFSYSY